MVPCSTPYCPAVLPINRNTPQYPPIPPIPNSVPQYPTGHSTWQYPQYPYYPQVGMDRFHFFFKKDRFVMKTTTKKRKTKRSFFIGNRFKKTVVSRFKQIIFSKYATKVNPVLKIYETVYKQAESMCNASDLNLPQIT